MTKAEKEVAKATKEAEVAKADGEFGDIIVGDPQVLRPVELPLVIKLPEGKSWTPEQQEYVNGLNGYAYKNPKKWAKKKNVLLARLIEIGNDPSKLKFYQGEPEQEQEGKVEYKNKLIQK